MIRDVGAPQDLLAGLFYIIFGTAAVTLAYPYGLGTLTRLGPGAFPAALGVLLVAIGFAASVRGFVKEGAPIGAIAWRSAVCITCATLVFAATVEPFGFFIAAALCLILGGLASRHFPWRWSTIAILLVLIVITAVLFIKVLGVPMTMAGEWLR